MMYRVIANGHTRYFGIHLPEALRLYYEWQQAGQDVCVYRYENYYYEA